jgi:hypothetical protein
MTTGTTQQHLDDTTALDPQLDRLDRSPTPTGRRRRRSRRTTVALVTSVVVVGALAASWAYADSSSHTPVEHAPGSAAADAAETPRQLVCDAGSSGVSVIAAAVDACLAPVRTQPFSLIAAIPMPEPTS